MKIYLLKHVGRLKVFFSLLILGVPILGFSINTTEDFPEEKLLIEILDEISRDYQVYFTYDSDLIKGITVDYEKREGESVRSILSRVLTEVNMDFKIFEDRFVILYRKDEAGLKSLEQMISHMEEIVKDRKEAFANRRLPAVPRLQSDKWSDMNRKRLVLNVSGRVMDTSGEPLIGVNVQVKGTNKGTATDIDGRFSFSDIDDQAVLVVSYIGYTTQEVQVEGKTSLTIIMQEDVQTLDEVVVVGYGSVKKATLTGAVSSVSSETFESRPISNSVDALQGTLPGLTVTRSSGQPGNKGFDVQLRGVSSINGGNSPLVLVDGLQSSLSALNPNDIESISVLKDGAAAIYGNQAANGVILITTKSGEKGKPKVSYNFTYGSNTPSSLLEKFTNRQYMEVVNQGFINDGSAPLYRDIFFDALGTDQVLNFVQAETGNDEGPFREDSYIVFNQPNDVLTREFYETGIYQNHNLGIGGGGNHSTYRLSIGYLNEDGVINTDYDDYKRYNIRLNNSFEFSEKLKLSMQNSFAMEDRSASTMIDNALIQMVRNWTLFPVRRKDGSYYTFRGFENPLDLLSQAGEANLRTQRLLSNARVDYNPFNDLTLTANLGLNHDVIQGRNETPTVKLINKWTVDDTPTYRISPSTDPNRLVETNRTENYVQLNAYFNYNKRFFEHHDFSVTGGFSHEQRRDNLIRAEARNFPTNDLFSLAIGDIDEARVDANGYSWTIRSFFGRLNYSYQDKYIFDANVRYDGSSRFDPNDRWGLFSGYALAWRVSEEDWIKAMNLFDNLKFRISYGETGNQEGIGYYDYLSLINVGSPIILGSPSGGMFGLQSENQYFTESGAVSLDRTWETVATSNLGVDIGIFKSKLNLSIDYFIKRNKNLLVAVDVPKVLGISAPTLNQGEMETEGFELELGWHDKIGNFNYYITGTLFNDKNKLTNLRGSASVKQEGVNNRLEGYSVGTYFGWRFDGIIQNQEELDLYTEAIDAGLPGGFGIGDVKYVDIDNNGELSALGNPANGDVGDLVELGNIRPQYSFGLTMGGEFKNFDLKILIQGIGKRTLFRTGPFSAPINAGQWFFQGLRYFYGKTWSPENPTAIYPRLSVNNGVGNYNYRPSENTKFNAAYARLKNLQIGYNLSREILSKIGFSKFRLFISGENITEIQTKKSKELGYDPESGNQLLGLGYPFVRTYSIGAQIAF